MLKTVAKGVSGALHPLLIPSIGLLFIFLSGGYLSLLPFQAKRIIAIVFVVNTFLLPLLMIPLFYRLGIIKSMYMTNHKERIVPLVFTLIPYLFTLYFLRQVPLTSLLLQYIAGGSIILLLTLTITLWWKVSIHMVAMGGLVGLAHVLTSLFFISPLLLLVPSIIAAGIVAWARLWLNAHKPSQVYAGFTIGWVVMLGAILFI